VRGILYSVIATVVGAALVGGGVWGLIRGNGDDKPRSLISPVPPAATSPPGDCARVAERDPRFRLPHDLRFGPQGRATVQCKGDSVDFSIELDDLEAGKFYDLYLERGGRRAELGTLLAIGGRGTATVTAGPDVDLRRYDYLTVGQTDFGIAADPAEPPAMAFRAPL
jgi:hypothetical protein